MSIEELINQKREAQLLLRKLEAEIRNYDAGFSYLFYKLEFGHSTYYFFRNKYTMDKLIEGSKDGDNYLFVIYTTDTNYNDTECIIVSEEEMTKLKTKRQ